MHGLERLTRFFVVTLVLIAYIALANPAFANRVALVIGNANYQHTVPLANPRNDAEAVSDALEQLGFDVFDGFDLSRSEAEDLIRGFARAATDADAALLYYAGHGLEVGGVNYLVPVDARISDEADLKFETINLTDILALMERSQRTNLIFLDACRDNPMANNLARNMGTRSTAIGRGLARVDTGVGTMIAYATQPGNVALDGVGRHSPFTNALLEHIDTPDLDVEIMMRRVRRDVMQQTGGLQVPWSSSSLTGSFMFQMQPPPPTALVVPQEQPQITTLQEPETSVAAIASTPPPQSAPPAADQTDIQVMVPPAPDTGTDNTVEIALAPAQPETPQPSRDSVAEVTQEVLTAEDLLDVTEGALSVVETSEQQVLLSAEDLARQSQAALNRLGCNAGTEDGIWGGKSRGALERLAENADAIELASLEPTEALLQQMESLEGRVCPLVCAVTENRVGDSCVRKTCASGQRLSSKGVCFTPRATASRNTSTSGSQSSCFTFNGQTFCD